MQWRKSILKRKKEVINKETEEIIWNSKICYICKEKLKDKYINDKKYCQVRDYCQYTGKYRGAAHRICNLRYSVLKEIPRGFCNESNFDDHFIIKMLPAEFEKQFIWFGENAEKYIAFLVPIEKELITIDKNGEEITNSISYRLQFIDNLRFMTSLLSNLVNNLAEEISKIK